MESINKKLFLDRLKLKGMYIVNHESRYFWANEDVSGCLIEPLSNSEILLLNHLVVIGEIDKQTKYISL